MKTIATIAQEILVGLQSATVGINKIWNYVQTQGSAVDTHLAAIDARLGLIEQAVMAPGTSPDQSAVDALTAQAQVASVAAMAPEEN